MNWPLSIVRSPAYLADQDERNRTLARQVANFAGNHPLPGEQPRQFPIYDGRPSSLEGRLDPNAVRASLGAFRLAVDENGILRLVPTTQGTQP